MIFDAELKEKKMREEIFILQLKFVKNNMVFYLKLFLKLELVKKLHP